MYVILCVVSLYLPAQPGNDPESTNVLRCSCRFVGRWGALFEENRGPPMVMCGATYATDPQTGLCNRGSLEPHLGRPVLTLRYCFVMLVRAGTLNFSPLADVC